MSTLNFKGSFPEETLYHTGRIKEGDIEHLLKINRYNNMINRHQQIKNTAYYLWKASGYSDNSLDFWVEAVCAFEKDDPWEFHPLKPQIRYFEVQ